MMVSSFQGVVEVQNLSKIRSFRYFFVITENLHAKILPNVLKLEVNYTYKVW